MENFTIYELHIIWLFYFYKNVISNSIVRATLRFVLKAGLKPSYFPLHWLNIFSRINTMSSVELLFFPPLENTISQRKKEVVLLNWSFLDFSFSFLMCTIFFLKITIIIQFKLTLCIYVYSSHILDRSYFNIWPYLYDYFICSTFWRENCRSFSGIICLIHWNKSACKIESILSKILLWKKVEKENKWTKWNIKLKNIFTISFEIIVFCAHNTVQHRI